MHACVTRALYAAAVVNFTFRSIYLRVKSAQFLFIGGRCLPEKEQAGRGRGLPEKEQAGRREEEFMSLSGIESQSPSCSYSLWA